MPRFDKRGNPVMDVKESVLWAGEWWKFFHGELKEADLPLAPQGRNLKKGTLTGSWNYKIHTLVNACLDPRTWGNDAARELLDHYHHQRENLGHMAGEELTPSHSFQHYFPHAMLLYYANRHGLHGLFTACLEWWRTEFELTRIFGTPIGVVAPGARGIKKGKTALAGRNPYRDQLYDFACSFGQIKCLPADKGKHPSTLIWSALRGVDHLPIALATPSRPIKLMFPVHKVTAADGSFTAWLPPEAMEKKTGLSGPQKPQMVACYDAKTRTDSYSAEPFGHDADVTTLQGRHQLIGTG